MSDGHLNVGRLQVVATATGEPVGAGIALPGALVDSCVCGDNLGVAGVFVEGGKGKLGVWDAVNSVARFVPLELPGQPISVAACPASQRLAVLCATGDLIVIDDRTGRRELELRHEEWTNKPYFFSAQVSFTPDGNSLISLGGGLGATINVRDAGTGELRFAPLRPQLAGAHLRSFAVSADSRLLATMALGRNEAQVWDLRTGFALSQPLPHPGGQWGLFSVRFSPDGRYLLTGHKDGQDRYWDWTGTRLACSPMANHNETHDGEITHDGRFGLAVVGGRPELHISDLATGRRIAPPVRVGSIEGGWCLTMALSPDGRRAMVSFSEAAVAESGESRFDLAVVDLEPLLSSPTQPTADLALLAELATGRVIELGDLSALTSGQWIERWKRLRAREPGLARGFAGARKEDSR